MPSPHAYTYTYTAGVAAHHLNPDDDNDDPDICPVCDGECTCHNQPLNSSQNQFPPAAATAASAPTLRPASASLKIKLTLPPSMLAKSISPPTRPSPYGPPKRSKKMCSSVGSSAGGLKGAGLATPKRRGRPPKIAALSRSSVDASPTTRVVTDHAAQPGSSGNGASTLSGPPPRGGLKKQQRRDIAAAKSKLKSYLQRGRGTTGTQKKNAGDGKRTLVDSDDDEDFRMGDIDNNTDDSDEVGVDDGRSVDFPTFVSASALSSLSSSDSSASSSSSSESDSDDDDDDDADPDSDPSIEAEEEEHIRAVYDRVRTKRELLGGEGGTASNKHRNGNEWVIHPRKRSVGPSDAGVEEESDVSDAEGEDDEDAEADEDADADAEDGLEGGDGMELAEDDDESDHGYVGFATGWSEDEESTFDADLFFANLSSSPSSDEDSDSDRSSHPHRRIDSSAFLSGSDGGHSSNAADRAGRMHGPGVGAILEVSHGWDGQLIFTNGPRGGHGALDAAFEASAAQLNAVADQNMNGGTSDVEMGGYERDGSDGSDGTDSAMDDDGDDDDDGGVQLLEESDGATTEDDLVGPDGLPTQRAMLLFRWPSGGAVAAINPLNTVSSPSAPSAPRRRHSSSRNFDNNPHSPNPADILAGRLHPYWTPSDSDSGEQDPAHDSYRDSTAQVRVAGGGPVMGCFAPQDSGGKRVVIDGKGPLVPSPYPRSKKGKRKQYNSITETDVFSSSHHSRTPSLSLPLPPSNTVPSTSTPMELSLGEVALADLLHASVLTASPSLEPLLVDAPGLSSASSEPEGGDAATRHLHSLSRWERVPMGAFRRTRTGAGGGGGDADAGMIRASPFGVMMAGRGNRGRKALPPASNIVISPLLLPIRERDAELAHTPPKNRKEARREKRMRKKGFAQAHRQHPSRQHQTQSHGHGQQQHKHKHYPNMKTRGSNAVQRGGFFGAGAVPSLNL